uniref:Uncharacterized protein n=1 Tax=Mycena chlorophos TaxID=658473 RepID=A0ABQ0L256_MYCCL|nr:predicted protein [Mycena chlorophos]
MSWTRPASLAQITEFCHWRSSPNVGGESSYPEFRVGENGYGVESPQLVMIFGWADAKLPQIMYYSDMYATMHPNTPQLIVECDNAAVGLGTTSMNMARMKPVAEYLLSLDMLRDKNCKWLIHTLSSGASMTSPNIGLMSPH